VTIARVFDLKDGSVVNTITLNKDPMGVGYNDAYIIEDKEDNLTYTIMTNSEVRVFQKDREVLKFNANDSERFVFVGYDYERETVVIGAMNEDKINAKLANEALPPISFEFKAESDILLKTWQYVLIINLAESSIFVYSIKDRTVVNNNIQEIIEEGYKVTIKIKSRSKTFYYPQI